MEVQAGGRMSDELAGVLREIVLGAVGRQYRVARNDRDDLVQEFVILVLERADRIDLAKAPFNYLTGMALNLARQRKRRERQDAGMVERYARRVAGAGRTE